MKRYRRSFGFTVLLSLLFCQAASALPPIVHTTAQLSEARCQVAAASTGDIAVFAGGFNYIPYESWGRKHFSTVDIYDNKTATWTTANLSVARKDMAAVSVGGQVMMAGGGYPAKNAVDIYDPVANTWSTDQLSEARYNLVGASVGDVAVFAGGGYPSSDVVDIYNTTTDTWSTSTLSLGRYQHAAASVGSKVLFAGGTRGYPIWSDRVDIYDVETGLWEIHALSVGRDRLAATTVGNTVIFAGGGNLGGSSDIVDIYDAETGLWSTATLSQRRHALAATTVGNLAFFAGGSVQESYSSTPYLSDVIDIYDAETGLWSTDKLSEARCSLAATTVGDSAMFAGGDFLDGTFTDVVDIYTIPEPATLSMLALGGLGPIWRRKRGMCK